jgi:ketosteroid isomerase-like protein
MLWGHPEFEKMLLLPTGGQRFIITYALLNGCHACEVAGSAHVAFDFDRAGNLLRTHLLGLTAVPINRRPLSPDERGSASQGDWDSFWSAFRAAVRRRDRKALKAMMTPNFEWNFAGEPNNPDAAFGYWDKRAWAALDRVLAQGTVPYQQGDPMKKNVTSRIAPPVATRDYYDEWRAVFELGTDGRWRWAAFVNGD